jgi:small subunit ribosomal protein SAe
MSQFPNALNPKEDDIAKMLACNVHIGTKFMEPAMARYIYKKRADGIFVVNLQKTWEKLILAARIIAAVENPQDVCVVSARPYAQRAALKFASFTGATALAGRFTPGTFTNQIQERNFMEPRLLVVTDPRTDYQPTRESAYVNIPTIAFCDSDTPLRYVDVVIPCNTRAPHSIGLMYWLLCREVLYLKDPTKHPRNKPWDVMVDLFFYREPEVADKSAEGEEATFTRPAAPAEAETQPTGEWGGSSWETTEWGATGSAAAPASDWSAASSETAAAATGGFDNSVLKAGWDAAGNEF